MPLGEFVRRMDAGTLFHAPHNPVERLPGLRDDIGLERLLPSGAEAVVYVWIGDTHRVQSHWNLADDEVLQIRGRTAVIVEPPHSPAGRYLASYRPVASRWTRGPSTRCASPTTLRACR